MDQIMGIITYIVCCSAYIAVVVVAQLMMQRFSKHSSNKRV